MATRSTSDRVRYGLWLVCGLCFIGIGASQWLFSSPVGPGPLPLAPNRPYVLTDTTTRHTFLLSLRSAGLVDLKSQILQVGTESLPTKTDSVGKMPFTAPLVMADWYQTMQDKLGKPGADSAARWQTAEQQCRLFIGNNMDSLAKTTGWQQLSGQEQLAYAFLYTLSHQSPGTSVYLIDRTFVRLGSTVPSTVSSATALSLQTGPTTRPARQSGLVTLLTVAGLLAALTGLVLTYQRAQNAPPPVTQSSQWLWDDPQADPETTGTGPAALQEAEPVASDEAITQLPERDTMPVVETTGPPPTDPPVQPPAKLDIPTGPTVIEQYLTRFYERYGDFYKFMQDIPVEPTPAEHQQIRRRLVEMALHAHSLARTHRHNPALVSQTIFDPARTDPNVWLVLNQQQVSVLPADAYKRFDPDPYKLAKHHQFLQKVLQSMDIGELEGALMQTVYVPPDFLKPV